MKEYFLIFPDKENREDGERIDQTLCEADYSVGDRLTLVCETEEKHYTVRGINHFLKDGLKHVSTAVLLGDAEQKEQSNSNWGIWFSWLDAINAATLLLSRITYSINPDYKLCYVKGDFAWFTTKELDWQTGYSWYEDEDGLSYAGEPHLWSKGTGSKYKIYKIAFDGGFEQPGRYEESSFSVNMINTGNEIPWLSKAGWAERETIEIYAGCSIDDFEKLIDKAGGRIYR